MPPVRQTNFLGGELAPLLHGRTDLELYRFGLRRMRNFFASRQGAAVSRPGTTYVGEAKSPGCRLVEFRGETDSVLLEVTGSGANLCFRFHQDGATVQGTYLPFDTVVTAFEEDEVVTGLTSGATGTIVNVGPTELQISKAPGPAFQDNEVITSASGSALVNGVLTTHALEVLGGVAAGTLAALKHAQFGDIMTFVHPLWVPIELVRLANVGAEQHWRIRSVLFATPAPYFSNGYPVMLEPLPVVDATHPAREWIWLATRVVQETSTGAIFETAPWRVNEVWDGTAPDIPTALADNMVALYPDRPVTILNKNGAVSHLDSAAGALANVVDNSYRAIATNYYRGRGGVFGFVGQTDTNSFVDTGAEPDFLQQPPRGTNPFLVTDYAGATTLQYPTAVAYFEERRVFARKGRIVCSQVGDFTNYDPHVYQVSGEALDFTLASTKREDSVHLVPGPKLLAPTRSSIFSFGGVQGAALDYDSVDARNEDETGAADVVPLRVGSSTLFVTESGLGARELAYDGQGGFVGRDISEHASHLFLGEAAGHLGAQVTRELVDWCLQQKPWNVVWGVKNDGQLVSLTRAGERAAWARHDTNGWVKAVCAVREGNEDAVYVVVARPNQDYPLGEDFGPFGTAVDYHIERMASRVRAGNENDDCCVDDAVKVTVFGYQLGTANPSIDLTGLDHLDGHSVYVVGVGNAPVGPLVVAGGKVTLTEDPRPNKGGYDAASVLLYGGELHQGGDAVLYVGMKYTCELETLDVGATDARTKPKVVKEVCFEVDQTKGLQGGQTFAKLSPVLDRETSSGYDAPVPETRLAIIKVKGAWGLPGRAVLRQELPLPVTVVGLQRNLEVGDDA